MALTDPFEGELLWKAEKRLRNNCNVSPDARDKLASNLRAKIAQIKATITAEFSQHDRALSDAAKAGKDALEATWAKVPDYLKDTLEAAMDRRHRPAATEVDAAAREGKS